MFWKPVISIIRDYFTKHHLPAYHKLVRLVYLNLPRIVHAYAKECYSYSIEKGTSVKPTPTINYNIT